MKRLLSLLLFAFALLSCEKEMELPEDPIAMEGFVLEKVDSDDSFLIVENKEQLLDILPMEYLDQIDFSKRNILLIHGLSGTVVDHITKDMKKVNDKYCFEITVYKSGWNTVDYWCVAYSISKQLTKEDIEVQISYQELQ